VESSAAGRQGHCDHPSLIVQRLPWSFGRFSAASNAHPVG